MRATYNPGVHRFAVFLVCWTILLFVAGALVTSNDAALSVPDWPKSHGSWIPPLDSLRAGALFEFSHRVIAGSLGLFMLIFAVVLWRKEERAPVRWLGVIALAGVVVQAVLGGQVVIQLLHYWLPVIHACFAQIVFAALLAIALFTSKWWISERPQIEDRGGTLSIHFLVLLNAVVIYLQVILGAGFRHKEIPIWPHIVGAGVVLGMVTWTAVTLRKRFGSSPELSRVRVLLHVILGTQLLLGFGAWWSRLSTADAQPMPIMVSLTVIHTVVGALLFGLAVAVVLLCYRLVPRRREALATAQREATIS